MALSRAFFASSQIPYANSGATSQGDKLHGLHDGKRVSSLNSKWRFSSHQSFLSTSFKGDHPIGNKSFTERHGRRLEEVKQLLRQVVRVGDSMEGLVMVDALRRLVIDYHFYEEIEAVIERQLPISATLSHHAHTGGLYESALRFRLLRQPII